jgi:hypothetical protein
MSLPLVIVPNRNGLAHTLLSHLCKIPFSITLPSMHVFHRVYLLQVFLQHSVALDSSPMLGTCSTHLILHKVIIIIIFAKEYKL